MFLVFRFRFSKFGSLNSYPMSCRLHSFLFGLQVFFEMFGLQNIRASASILVVPSWPKCNVSNCSQLYWDKIFSSLNVRPHLLESFSNIGQYWSGAVFFSPLLMTSLTRLSSASVANFAMIVFKSSMKLNSALFIVSSAALIVPEIFRCLGFVLCGPEEFSAVKIRVSFW